MATTTAWIPRQTGWARSGVATIDSGETESLPIPCNGKGVVRLGLPEMTGTSLTFKVQAFAPGDPSAPTADPPFRELVDASGQPVTVTITGQDVVVVPDLSGCYAFTIVSNAAEGAARAIEVSMVGEPGVGPFSASSAGGTTAQSRVARKTVTFTGAAGAGAVGTVNVFTVTGRVIIEAIVPYCSTNLGEAAPTATVALGVADVPELFVAATTSTAIDAGEYWTSTTPTAGGVAIPAAMQLVAVDSDIIITCAAQNTNAGVIAFTVIWTADTAGASVVAA